MAKIADWRPIFAKLPTPLSDFALLIDGHVHCPGDELTSINITLSMEKRIKKFWTAGFFLPAINATVFNKVN